MPRIFLSCLSIFLFGISVAQENDPYVDSIKGDTEKTTRKFLAMAKKMLTKL